MHGTIRRIWWTVGSVAALLLVVAVILVVRARAEAARVPELAAARATTRTVTPVSSQRPTSALAPMAGAASAPVAALSRGAGNVIEVCGLPPVRLSSSANNEDNDRQLDDAVANAPTPWVDMQASSDERIRAAGFALGGRIEPLAKLAASTRDATVYAMAQSACVNLGNDPASGTAATDKAWCETLDADQRTTLEPDNAIAWLQLAVDAESNRDATTVDDALRRAAAAPALRHHTTAAALQVDRHAATARAAAAPLWVHRALEESGLRSALIPTSICAERSRREVCLQIAQRLLDQPHAIGDLAQGLALARQAGLDEATLARKRDELEAVQLAETARIESLSGANRYSCAVLGGQRDWLRKTQTQGEWRAAREAAVAQAGSFDALLQRHRESAGPGTSKERERR